MLRPLQEWICDDCGQVIQDPKEGYVIWRADRDDEYRAYDFHIIHQGRCDARHQFPCSMPLDTFLGQEGISYLLAMLSVGPVKRRLGTRGFVSVKDIDEFVDFMRRVQVPHYEEARTKFNEQQLLEDLADSNEVAPYVQDTLKRIISDY